jgi:hypothetical protein
MNLDDLKADNEQLRLEIANARLKRRRDRAVLESSYGFDWVTPYAEFLDTVRTGDP